MVTINKSRWIIVLSVAILIVFSLLVPPFQSPDEPAHLRYIQFISQYRSVPSPGIMNDATLLNYSPNITEAIDELESTYISRNPNNHFQYYGTHKVTDEPTVLHYIFNHPPLYYIWGGVVFSALGGASIVTKLLVIRSLNAIFLIIAGAYLLRLSKAFKLTKLQEYLLLISTLCWPMFSFISSGVNNDVLLTVASIAFITVVAELLKSKKKLTLINLLELGLWINIGVLTKAPFVPLLTLAVLLLIQILRRKQLDFRKALVHFVSLSPSIIYFTDKVVRYGSLYPTPQLLEADSDLVVGTAYKLAEVCTNLPVIQYAKILVYPRIPLILQSFVGNFGWLDTKVPLIFLFIFCIVVLFGVIGLMKNLYKSIVKKKVVAPWIIVTLTSIASMELFYIYLYLRTYIPNCYLYFPVQGRYYFPILLPIMLLMIKGLESVFPHKALKHIYSLLVIMSLYYSVYVITFIVERYYL